MIIKTRFSNIAILVVYVIMTSSLMSMNDDENYTGQYSWANEKKRSDDEKSESISDLHDSTLLDEASVGQLMMDCLANPNQEETLELIKSILKDRSPATQYNLIETCINAVAHDKDNVNLANALYVFLADIYELYIKETAEAKEYRARYAELAKQYTLLTSHKLPALDLTRIDGSRLQDKYYLVEVNTPRSHKRIQETKFPRKATLEDCGLMYFKELPLQSAEHVYLTDKYFLGANSYGNLHCYSRKRCIWRQTLTFPGKPILFAPFLFSLEHDSLCNTDPFTKEKITIISTLFHEQPSLCSYYKSEEKNIPSFLLEGTHEGAVVMHEIHEGEIDESIVDEEDTYQQKSLNFIEKHKAPITALLALWPYAYSASADRTLKQWDLRDKKCTNQLEGLAHPIHQLTLFQGNVIARFGPRELVQFNLYTNPPTYMTLYKILPQEDASFTAMTTFDNRLLIAGTDRGRLKIFTPDFGFNDAIDINPQVDNQSVKSLVSIDKEKKLLMHFGSGDHDHLMILSQRKPSKD